MDNEWLSSLAALNRAKTVLDDASAKNALVQRASNGLIATKASRFITEEGEFDNHVLPREFWKHIQNCVRAQQWSIGDFAPVIHGDLHPWLSKEAFWKAFDVSFHRNSIENLVNMSSPGTPALNKRGRPEGSGGFDDSALIQEMSELIVNREVNSVSAAAQAVSLKACGNGSRESTEARLRQKYGKKYSRKE